MSRSHMNKAAGAIAHAVAYVLVLCIGVFGICTPHNAFAVGGDTSQPRNLAPAGVTVQSVSNVANFAVYSEADHSLTFLYSESAPTTASFGKEVTAVYDGYASKGWAVTRYERVDLVPWWDYMRQIQSVTFRDVTRPASVAFWFCQASNEAFTSIDCTNLDLSNAVDARSMFFNCKYLESIDTSSWDTSNITCMASMFQRCSSLTDVDISHFDTHNVETMASMFAYCSSLTSIDITTFNTSKANNLGRMFDNCTGAEVINVSGIDTSKAYLGYMFYNCQSVTYLDLSSFDTGKTTSLAGLFGNCSSLTTIVLGEEFDFFGKGMIRDKNLYGIFPTPPSDDGVHNGKWASPNADSYPQYTPLELRTVYDGATMAGVYTWATKASYHVSFDANGGTGAMAPIDVDPSSPPNVPACGFTRTGYVFIEWNTKADGTGVAYGVGELLAPTSAMTLYAQWDEARMVIEVTDEAILELGADGSITSPTRYPIVLTNKGNVDIRVSGIRYEPLEGASIVAEPTDLGEYELWMEPKGGTRIELSRYATSGFVELANASEWLIPSGARLRMDGVGGISAGMEVDSATQRIAAGRVLWRFASVGD